MAEDKHLGKFFVYCGLILVFFLIMMPVVFSFKGRLVRAEVLILLFLMLLALTGFAGYKKSWGERILFFLFLIGLANMIFIWHFTGKLFMLPLFLGLIGLLMSLPKKREELKEGAATEKKPVAKTKIETEYSPGKYVASKMGNVYHEPRCEWAKKIAEDRRVWFKDKKEAQKKGYKAHKCVK